MAGAPASGNPLNPPNGRTRHPFFMHEMIRRQTVAARATFGHVSGVASGVTRPPKGGAVGFVGIGSSYHAALSTARSASAVPGLDLVPVPLSSFDVAETPGSMSGLSAAVVFSSGGETPITLEAQRQLKSAKIPIALITANPTGRSSALAEFVLTTQYSDEGSWTHTVSYTTALVAGLCLLRAWSDAPAWPEWSEEGIVEATTTALATEGKAVELVESVVGRREIMLLGSGTAEATAREGALKLREAAGRYAVPVGVEEVLHGSLPSLSDRSLLVAFSTTEREHRRALDALAAAEEIGCAALHIDSSGAADSRASATFWPLRPAPPHTAPIPLSMPIQLLAYWLAVSDGRNPDVMGLDDPRQARAWQRFLL